MTEPAPASTAVLQTRACALFGVRYPIVQTGMGWVSDATLTAASANAGALGILSSVLLTLDELATAVREVKAATTRPFGVNLRADQPDALERIDLMAAEGVRVASFAMAPREAVIERCKHAGLLVVPSVGARRHAEKVAAMGADAVVVQGGEGGGHTGSVPTSLLLPQVVDAVEIPVVAAGGYFDGRGLVAALAYGAEGIAMGTRFLLTSDSPVRRSVQERYLAAGLSDTMLTTQIDGWPQRVLATGFAERLDGASGLRRWPRAARSALQLQRMSSSSVRDLVHEGLDMRRRLGLSWTQVLTAANAPMLYKRALLDGDAEGGVMATGQVVGLIDDLPSCGELVDRIMREAEATLAELSGREPR